MNTLLLDTSTWDLCIDASGNIAMASNPYSLAQDAACAMKMFLTEYWYDTGQGVPYLQQVLGITPVPLSLIKSVLEAAALTVPEVTQVQVFITGIANRVLTGQVQIMNNNLIVATADFTA